MGGKQEKFKCETGAIVIQRGSTTRRDSSDRDLKVATFRVALHSVESTNFSFLRSL